MYNEQDFLRAIAEADADDDSPCWMYADWLEEQGSPRGEFVRLQCELERSSPWATNRRQLVERCQQLLLENSAEWVQPLEAISYVELRFRRGVPSDVEWSAEQFLAQGRELMELAPTINRLKLTAAADHVEALSNSLLWQFTHVDLSGNNLGDPWLSWLLQGGDEARIRFLDLGSNDLTSQSVGRLLHKRWAREAEWALPFNRLTESAAEVIADEAARTSLAIRGLGLRGNRIGDEGFHALATSRLADLTLLDLRDNGLTANAGHQLAQSIDCLPSLETLDLRENSLQVAGAQHLARSTLLNGVTNLQLRNNGITCAGVEALVQSERLDAIQVLGLGNNQIRDRGAELAFQTPNLKYLDLSGNLLSDYSAQFILDRVNDTEIEVVDISSHHFTYGAEAMLERANDERVRHK